MEECCPSSVTHLVHEEQIPNDFKTSYISTWSKINVTWLVEIVGKCICNLRCDLEYNYMNIVPPNKVQSQVLLSVTKLIVFPLSFTYFQIYIVYNKRTGKPRGYAFIEYEHERDMHCKFPRLARRAYACIHHDRQCVFCFYCCAGRLVSLSSSLTLFLLIKTWWQSV